MINPWIIIGILVSWIGSLAGVGYWQYGAGKESERVVWQARDLAIKEAAKAFTDLYRESETVTAKTLETKLASLRANERIIEREKLKIIDRPIYRTDCIDLDGLRAIESARIGKSSADSTKPAD